MTPTNPTFADAEEWEEAIGAAFHNLSRLAYLGHDEYGQIVQVQIDTRSDVPRLSMWPEQCEE